MMIFVYFTFLIISILKLLYFTYLFQIKEYRIDRIKSFFNEEGILKALYGFQIKKPAHTNRNLFIIAASFLPEFVLFLYLTEIPYYFGLLAFVLSPVIAFIWVALFVLFTSIPVAIYRFSIVLKARWKLRGSKTTFIGVTGSYGKSTVKEFLYHILSSKYKVAKTDKNMNTDVGVSLSILKNLNKNTEYFIGEVGAYTRGEIKAAAGIFKPKYGIITALGNQHLDLFGSKENLIKAKFELIDMLPEDGKGYINADTLDNKKIQESYKAPLILFSRKPSFDIYIANYRIDNNQTNAHIVYGNKKIDIITKLLGEHSIMNLLPCIALAFDLGMSRHEIQKAIETLEPVEGKLSLHTGVNNSTVMNDGYNSNVEGFIAGIKTLRKFSQKNKIIISRGIIELGVDKTPSYQKIINELEKTSLKLFTTDPLFKELNTQQHVSLFSNEYKLMDELKKELQEGTAVLIEGRFPEDIINTIIAKK